MGGIHEMKAVRSRVEGERTMNIIPLCVTVYRKGDIAKTIEATVICNNVKTVKGIGDYDDMLDYLQSFWNGEG